MNKHYVIDPNGKRHTRNSQTRTYSHAVLVRFRDETRWACVGWCGRPDLAEKKAAEYRYNGHEARLPEAQLIKTKRSKTMEHIKQAIERSRSYNEIVTLDWDAAAIDDAVEYIAGNYDGETDCVSGAGVDGDITEVWGWTDEQSEGEMDFRVHLRAVEGLGE